MLQRKHLRLFSILHTNYDQNKRLTSTIGLSIFKIITWDVQSEYLHKKKIYLHIRQTQTTNYIVVTPTNIIVFFEHKEKQL